MEQPSSPTPWVSSTPWKDVHEGPGAFPVSPRLDPSPHAIAQRSLSAQLKARKSEYVRKQKVKVKVGTWNVASFHGTEKDLGAWFVHGLGVKGLSENLANLSVESRPDLSKDAHIESVTDQENRRRKKSSSIPKGDVPAVPGDDEIGLYVLGLQEVVDISSITGALRPYAGPDPAGKWKKAVEAALPRGYKEVAEHQLFGLLILIYASPEVYPSIGSVSATSVGTGIGGYLGNKGAVSVRIVLGETTRLAFVNCHLAAGADKIALERRIWDTEQIVTRTRFTPVDFDSNAAETASEMLGDEDFGFWFGDLNYRLDDIPGEDVRRLLLLHTRNEYDVINKSKVKIDSELGYISAPQPEPAAPPHHDITEPERPATESSVEPPLDPKHDPASLHTTLQSLLRHDQLRNQQRLGKAFHDGWREGDINFLPTYKYDVGSVGMFDSGEKKRSPSWCDRILFRTRKDREEYLQRVKSREAIQKKDADLKARGIDTAAAEQDVLFDYNPNTDGQAYSDDPDEEEDASKDAELIQTREGFEDSIELDHYISHQRILSSDHKPLDAIFTLTYDAVIPALKAQVQHDIAREMDKAENEGRPNLTLVVDSHSENGQQADKSAETLDLSIVDFGDVRYGLEKSRTLTVANTGQSSATFSFVGKPGEDNVCGIVPKWLKIHFQDFTISADGCVVEDETKAKEHTMLPGETTIIELAALVIDPSLVQDLNEGSAVLEDVLVLRIVDGRDHFIPLKGVWQPSALYRTLEELVRLPEGGARAADNTKPSSDTAGQHSAPKELFSLTEAVPKLMTKAMAEWEMMHGGDTPPWQDLATVSTWPFDPASWTLAPGEERSTYQGQVREALDTGTAIDANIDVEIGATVQLEVIAETLVDFLESLRHGIITTDMFSTIDSRMIQTERSRKAPMDEDVRAIVMEILSSQPVHSVSFTFVTFMLTRIVDELLAVVPETALPSCRVSTRSRASTVSSRSSTSSSDSISISNNSTKSKRFFSQFRRHRQQRSTSASTAVSDKGTTALVRRQHLVAAYVEVFSPLIVKTDADPGRKEKDRRALMERRRRILESFLQET